MFSVLIFVFVVWFWVFVFSFGSSDRQASSINGDEIIAQKLYVTSPVMHLRPIDLSRKVQISTLQLAKLGGVAKGGHVARPAHSLLRGT